MVNSSYAGGRPPRTERMTTMPKSTHSKRANAGRVAEAARRDPLVDRRAFLLALQSEDDAQIEATWPGAVVAKAMLADEVIAMHGDGDYSITGRGLAELMDHHGSIEPVKGDGDPRETDGHVFAADEPGSQEEYANAVLDERHRAESEDATQEQLDAEYDATVLEIRAELGTTCACGCGAGVTPKRVFRQGHDQRLIGVLAEATAAGKEIGHLQGGVLVTGSPRSYGAKVLADGGQYKLASAIKRAQEQLQARVARTLAKKTRSEIYPAKAARIPSETGTPATDVGAEPGPGSRKLKSVPAGPALGDEVGVRVGRHIYNARIHGMNQAGKVTAVEYTVKSSGTKKVATEGQFTLTAN